MSAACARLVNAYDLSPERIGFAANATAVGSRSTVWLRSYLEGEGPSFAVGAYFLSQKSEGCGMRLAHPGDFPAEEVEPIERGYGNAAPRPSYLAPTDLPKSSPKPPTPP
jgi:hypothetical protein